MVQTGERKKLDSDFRNGCAGPKFAMRCLEDRFQAVHIPDSAGMSPHQAARPVCLCVFVMTSLIHFRFFSVLGTILSASFVSAAVCLALPTASCKAARSASFFGLNFSSIGSV